MAARLPAVPIARNVQGAPKSSMPEMDYRSAVGRGSRLSLSSSYGFVGVPARNADLAGPLVLLPPARADVPADLQVVSAGFALR